LLNASYRRAHRLLESHDFTAAIRYGRRFMQPAFTLYVRCNALSWPRLGLAVSRRNVRRAALRNRLKRVMREVYREMLAELPRVDLVVLVHASAAAMPPAHFRQHFHAALRALPSTLPS
jgi:ribonuclease P protein component